MTHATEKKYLNTAYESCFRKRDGRKLGARLIRRAVRAKIKAAVR